MELFQAHLVTLVSLIVLHDIRPSLSFCALTIHPHISKQ